MSHSRIYQGLIGALLCAGSLMAFGQPNPDVQYDTLLERALQNAISKKDYRLYGLQNLHMTLPGIDPHTAAATIQRCGVKLLKTMPSPETQQHVDNGSQLQFATRYNQEILPLCHQHKG